MTEKLVILGGGLSAVTLAYYLGQPATIVEMEKELGGLCRTMPQGYDLGGHVIFGEQTAVSEMLEMLDGNYASYERCNKILYNNRLVDYPFENGAWELSPQERYEFGENYLLGKKQNITLTNFRDWLLNKYGTWLSHKYLIPFNEKLWKMDLRKISLDWTERIPNPSDEEILSAICGIKRQGYARLKNFYYPLEGGISKLIEGYLKHARAKAKIEVMLGYRVTQINPKHNSYQIVCGSPDHGVETVIEADRIINTMPLPELCKCLMNVPDAIYHALQGLEWLGLNVGHDKPSGEYPQNVFAIYDATNNNAWHRLCNYEFFGKPFYTYESTVKKQDLSQYKYAYPVYTHNRAKDTKTILDYAESLGIKSVGRMATMQYLNMDAVINQVKQFVKENE